MIQHYISTFLLYTGIILLFTGLLISLYLSIIGLIIIGISPYIQNKKYEYENWKNIYLNNK